MTYVCSRGIFKKILKGVFSGSMKARGKGKRPVAGLQTYLDINHGKTHCSDAWHEQSTKYIKPLSVCVLHVDRAMPQMWDLTNIQCFSRREEPFICKECGKAFTKKDVASST